MINKNIKDFMKEMILYILIGTGLIAWQKLY